MPSNQWAGIAATTAPEYLKGASDLTIRERLKLGIYRKKGRMVYNASGTELKWQVEFSQPDVETYGDGGVIDFSRHDAFKQLSVDWRGYVTRDTISKKQNAMNSGDNALINDFQTKMNRLVKSLRDNFSGELNRDGEASGREEAVHGHETYMTEGTCAAGDRIAISNDTYGLGALSTVPGDHGGAWSTKLSSYPNATIGTDWPDGNGDSEYDFLTPKLVNWSSNAWGTGSALWEDNCWRAISQTITWLTTTGGSDGMPDYCGLASNLFQGYKNHEEAIRRISIPHKTASDLGFEGNTLNQDGVAIHSDFDIDANTGYMENCDTTTLYSMFPELFWMEGPDKDPRTLWSWLFGVGFFGNVTYQPKFNAKLKNYA